MLLCHVTVIHWSKPRNSHWYNTINWRPFSNSTSCSPLFFFFCPCLGSYPGSHIAFRCVSSSVSSILYVSQYFFVFYNLDIFEEYWSVVLSNVPQLGIIWCFLMIEINDLGKNTTEIMCPSQCIIITMGFMMSICIIVGDVDLDHLDKVGFSTVKLLSFPL